MRAARAAFSSTSIRAASSSVGALPPYDAGSHQAPVVNVVAAALILLSIIPIYFAQKLAGTDESVAAAR